MASISISGVMARWSKFASMVSSNRSGADFRPYELDRKYRKKKMDRQGDASAAALDDDTRWEVLKANLVSADGR